MGIRSNGGVVAVLALSRFLAVPQGKVAILQRHEFDAPVGNHPLFASPFAAKLILHKRPRWVDGPEAGKPSVPLRMVSLGLEA